MIARVGETARKWWNAIRSIPAIVMPDSAFFLNDPSRALPAPLVFSCPTVELPRGAQLLRTRQSFVAGAPTFFSSGTGPITEDPLHRADWQNLPVEFPRNQHTHLQRAAELVSAPTYADPTQRAIFELTIPPAFVFEQLYQDPPGPRTFAPIRPDPTQIWDQSIYPDFTGLIEAQPWQAAWPKQPSRRTLTSCSSEIHVTLPLPVSLPIIEDWSAGPQVPVRYLKSPRHQDTWPASDPILVAPTSIPPFPATVPGMLPSKVRRPLPPLTDHPIQVQTVVIPPGPAESSHSYEYQIGVPLRTAYRRPVLEGGAVRVPTFLVEVIEDVYQVWNVQIGVPVQRKTLRPQPSPVAELSRTAPAQVPPMEPWDVSPMLPARSRLLRRSGESVGKVLPFLEDVSVAQGWSMPVAPRPAAPPFRVFAQPETIATLPEAIDVRIWHFELCQTQPVARPSLAGRWPTPAVVIAPVVVDRSLLALEYLVAQGRPAGRRLPQHTQLVTLERTAPAQIPAMEPFDVVQRPLCRQQVLRQPAEAPTKLVPAVEDIFLLEAWVQPAPAYPPRQPRVRPLSQEQRSPETAFFLNVPYNAASFQVWNVTPQPVPQWRRAIATVPQQQVESQTSPAWQASQVIVVAGPYVAIAASIYVAGALQGEARNE